MSSRRAGDDFSSRNGLPQHLEQIKQNLAEAREEVRQAHGRGLPALRVCARLTSAADAAISALWRSALADLDPREAERLESGCVLVAHGGYGRRQLAPHSDIDLMVLHNGAARSAAESLSRRLTSEMFDIGLEPGHSLRSIDDALHLAPADPVIATSLLESRHLIGSQATFERFFTAFRASTQRRGVRASEDFVEARRKERQKYGETVYLLEPNLKRSRGGLREVHLLRWLWYVQLGISDLDRVHAAGAMSKYDHHRLISARDFLLRTRNELHFGSARAGDTLYRHEQLRLAEALGYHGAEGMLPVEQFMRDYFRHAGFVWLLASRVSELTTRRRTVAKAIEPILSRSVANNYRIGFSEITATDAGRKKLSRDTAEVLHLLTLARDHDKRIAQDTWYAVYRAAPDLPAELTPEATKTFMTILAEPRGLGELLRRAHHLRVLERVVPAFRGVRCLLQFNQYHKFTVDEHSLRSIDLVTRFGEREDHLGKAYRSIEDRGLLHLALLLHDTGKALEGDHSVTGEQLAIDTADRLGLSRQRTERLATLVRRHLSMSHLAFRRDTHDPSVLGDFAKQIGDAETMVMLFVLTCADMAAVGPDVLNDWKISVLADLNQRALDRLQDRTLRVEDRRNAIRMSVWQTLKEDERDRSEFKEQFEALPEPFLTSRSPAAIASSLRRLQRVASHAAPPPDSPALPGVDAWGGYASDDSTVEMVAAVADGAGRGVFASMAGALSSKALRILSAETSLLPGGVLLLRFTAEDPNPALNAAEANRRVRGIATALIHSVDNHETPKLPKVWGADRVEAGAALSGMPNEVRLDTRLSDECVIVEVFTIDQAGLLYELARTLHEVDLVIRFAKIATSLDQVVDVFYVTDRDGAKPIDEGQLNEVSRRLMAVIERD